MRTGIPKSKHPLWTLSRHGRRQLEGWKLVAWLLLVAWWWLPTLFVVLFFYYTFKIVFPIAVWLFNYGVDLAREVKREYGH